MGKLGNFGYGGEQRSYSFSHFAAGYIAVGTAAGQGPNIPCEMVFLGADADNDGQVYIGGSDVSAVTGYQLDAGDATGWISIQNLNLIWVRGSSASQRLSYMLVY